MKIHRKSISLPYLRYFKGKYDFFFFLHRTEEEFEDVQFFHTITQFSKFQGKRIFVICAASSEKVVDKRISKTFRMLVRELVRKS